MNVLEHKDLCHIDLHIHTYYSDGEDSPKEAVRWAAKNNAKEIAITDHDNIDGVIEGKIEADKTGLIFHTGIEFSTVDDDGIEMHLLGYDIDINNLRLKEVCKDLALKRKVRNEKMLNLLEEFCGLQEKDVVTREGQSFIGKPMMARALVRTGNAETFQEAFDNILERPDFKRIKKEKINVLEAIDIVKEAGGKAVLAHPGLIKSIGERGSEEFYLAFEKILIKLIANGLDGVECVYRKHTEDEEEKFTYFAQKYGLQITRGSDYHGVNSL